MASRALITLMQCSAAAAYRADKRRPSQATNWCVSSAAMPPACALCGGARRGVGPTSSRRRCLRLPLKLPQAGRRESCAQLVLDAAAAVARPLRQQSRPILRQCSRSRWWRAVCPPVRMRCSRAELHARVCGSIACRLAGPIAVIGSRRRPRRGKYHPD